MLVIILECGEDKADYLISNPNNMHDKLFRDLLNDKKDLADFLNKYLEIKVQMEELEKYNSSYITKNYENNEADIVYKIKNKKIYFLVEHQSTVDNSMPFRILNYNLEIIKDTTDINRVKRKNYKYAKIIPIVIYTGNKKWNVSKSFSELQEKFDSNNYLELTYKLIDINNYSKEELLEGNTMIEKAMLIEKCKNQDELVKTIEKILFQTDFNNLKEVGTIKRIVQYSLANKFGEGNAKKFVEQINKKTRKEGVSMLWENLAKEEKQWEKAGEKKRRKKETDRDC